MFGGLVTVLESGVKGFGYPCARCDAEFGTVREQDEHHARVHGLHWSR